MNFPSKPPPAAFKRIGISPKPRFFDRVEGLMPMRGDKPAWLEVLKLIKYPTVVVVLDWESYFDAEYGMKALSTIEYITSPKWEAIGLAHLTLDGKAPFADPQAQCEIGEERIRAHIEYLKGLYGPRFEGCVISNHNSKFDLSVLRMKHGIVPRYVIDTLDLARAWNARQTHGLADLAKQWGLIDKGDTSEFKGLTLRTRYTKAKGKKAPKMPIRVPTATPEQLTALAAYATNDVVIQSQLLKLLLPRLSNPTVEVKVMAHTLRMFLEPSLGLDMDHGQGLIKLFNSELGATLEKAKVLCGH